MAGIGSFVAEARRQRGWTQEGLAARLGVSAQAVSKWETEQSMPDVGMLRPLAEALECTVDDLLGGDPAVLSRTSNELPGARVTSAAHAATKVVVRIEDPSEPKPIVVTVPVGLLKFGLSLWESIPALANAPAIDTEALMDHITRGLVGEVMRVETGEGGFVVISLE